MSQLDQQDYYAVRAAVCRGMAQRAASLTIAAIHAELATRYEELAAQPDRNERVMLVTAQRA